MDAPICETCGTQYPPAPEPPDACPICKDERQYVGHRGQRWTTMAQLGAGHRNRIEPLEPGLTGIVTEPKFAIGERAVVRDGLLWDCVALLDDAAAEAVEAAGGIHTIAISHPHYYTSMHEWAERFGARILLHAADRQHIMRPSPRIELWDGERLAVDGDTELIRVGGHFAGGTVCLWRAGAAGRGALLTGDIVQVAADVNWASFMWSYPNFIPLPGHEVARIRSVLETLEFERVYGAFEPGIMDRDAKAKVLRSADRYLAALERPLS